MSEELPPNWEERFDASSNQKYFVNVVTFASQWEKPTQSRPTPPLTPSQPPQSLQTTPIPSSLQTTSGVPQQQLQSNASFQGLGQQPRMGQPNQIGTQPGQTSQNSPPISQPKPQTPPMNTQNTSTVPPAVRPTQPFTNPNAQALPNAPRANLPNQTQGTQSDLSVPNQQMGAPSGRAPNGPQQNIPSQANEIKLPPNWEERFDTASQRKYFVNVVTTESQWDPPVMETPIVSENAVAETELPPNWEERFDTASQQKYYVNIVSHVTQWERPTIKKEEIKLPPNWEERFDANSGNYYYVNIVTRESQWEPPVLTPNEPSPTGLGLNFGDKQSGSSLGVFSVNGTTDGTFVQTASANAKPLKFVTVGDGAVGKTCLLISFTKNSFPKEYVPTVFDNHSTVVVYEGKEYNLGLWDTAGQEEYDRLRPLSYPNTDCFLMCYAVISPPSLDNCKSKWRNEVNHYCPDAKLLLIGTKIDLRNDSETLLKLEEQHSHVLSPTDGEKACKELNCSIYIECSARTQENIKKVFDEAIRVCTAPVKKKKSKCSIL